MKYKSILISDGIYPQRTNYHMIPPIQTSGKGKTVVTVMRQVGGRAGQGWAELSRLGTGEF